MAAPLAERVRVSVAASLDYHTCSHVQLSQADPSEPWGRQGGSSVGLPRQVPTHGGQMRNLSPARVAPGTYGGSVSSMANNADMFRNNIRHCWKKPWETQTKWTICMSDGVEGVLGGMSFCRVVDVSDLSRSEERRGGKECRSRWSRYH